MRFALLLLTASVCSGESCPWLNAPTASGLLAGPVRASYSKGECHFVGTRDELTIMVSSSSGILKQPAGCEALKGIGNQAFYCAGPFEQITGRVRDSKFVILLRSNSKDRDKLINVAEQVAGSLF